MTEPAARGWREEIRRILAPPFTRNEVLLLASLLLLLSVIWVEPRGFWLGEPDETRYAEIPREMLATGDFLTPRLNGMPYFEKPPLLYWANAASFRLFGESPWAARLPARLASLGTTLLLLAWASATWGRPAGLAAAIFYLASPLGFALSRLNFTDGLLTFFFTGTLFAAFGVIRLGEAERRTWPLSSAVAILAAAGFLAKGLVAVVLPAVILCLWCLLSRRPLALRHLAIGPALPLFLLIAAPWFFLMEQRHPGFLEFFFVREHLQRFTSPIHDREGPFYYFLLVLLGGFLPGVPFLVRGLRDRESFRGWRALSAHVFLLVWLVTVTVFFSLSQSKLIPYLLPAFPAAAALAGATAVRLSREDFRTWRVGGLLGCSVAAAFIFHPQVRSWISDYRMVPSAVIAATSLCLGAWLLWRGHRRPAVALSTLAASWTGFYFALVLVWPRTPFAVEVHGLGRAAEAAARSSRASVAGFRTYLYGVPWALKSPVGIVGSPGEMKPRLGKAGTEGIFWSEKRFWDRWSSGQPLLALVREQDLQLFATPGPSPQVIARGKQHFLIANFSLPFIVTGSPITSAGLYGGEPYEAGIPLTAVPSIVIERARQETHGRALIWALQEWERGRRVYEVITGGRKPQAIEISPDGQLLYIEEEIFPEAVPTPVAEGLSRVEPSSRIAFVTREYRRANAPSVLYEVHLAGMARTREVCFADSGRQCPCEDSSEREDRNR